VSQVPQYASVKVTAVRPQQLQLHSGLTGTKVT